MAQPFAGLAYHAQVLPQAVPASPPRLAAQDASFMPTSGKHTPGRERFYNGCAGRVARGWEIRAWAVIELTPQGASIAALAQTPARPALPATAAPRLDHAIQPGQAARPALPADVQ